MVNKEQLKSKTVYPQKPVGLVLEGRSTGIGQIVQASLVECYYNRTITRFSIQTAGLAFGGTGLCSYHVRGVGGSCAEHLTVESYTVIISLQS